MAANQRLRRAITDENGGGAEGRAPIFMAGRAIDLSTAEGLKVARSPPSMIGAHHARRGGGRRSSLAMRNRHADAA